jgi:hypothetical protein
MGTVRSLFIRKGILHLRLIGRIFGCPYLLVIKLNYRLRGGLNGPPTRVVALQNLPETIGRNPPKRPLSFR